MTEAAETTVTRARPLELSASHDTLFRIGVAVLTAVAAAFLFARLTVWPPHEDETLALFAGRGSVGQLIRTVLGERGGAPLHFLFAWVITHTGGGLVELRLVSTLFAVASVPLIAMLVARLTDRAVALVATAIVVPSWMLLFPVAVHFKGSGFYSTDYGRGKRSGKEGESTTTSGDKPAEKPAEKASTDSKPKPASGDS